MRFRIAALAATPEAFTSTADEERDRPVGWALERFGVVGDPHSFVLGAFDGSRLIGTAGLSAGSQLQARHKALLFGMAVASDQAGRGVGGMLVEKLCDTARASGFLRQILLTVSEGNAAAVALYRSRGFEQFGLEPAAVIVDGRAITKLHMIRFLDRPG